MKIREISTALLLISGLTVALTMEAGPVGAQESQATTNPEAAAGREFYKATGCDADSDGYIDAKEATQCGEQAYGELSGGETSLTQEQFVQTFAGAENPEGLFGQVDKDGDGQISQDEWTSWHEQGFAAATEASEGRMPAPEFETGDWAYVRPTPSDEQQKSQ
jgi:EF hand